MILSIPFQIAWGSHNVCIYYMGIVLIIDLARMTLSTLFNNQLFQDANFDWILSRRKLKSDFFLTLPCINGKPRYLPRLLANFIVESWESSRLSYLPTFPKHMTRDFSKLTFNLYTLQKLVRTLARACI
jgi:hypothetical protein